MYLLYISYIEWKYSYRIKVYSSDSIKTKFGTGLQPPPPLVDIKIVYSYVIEVADSESDLGLHGKALVSEILVFLRIRVTCIFQLNDLFALLFEKMHLLIHPQIKYPTYTLKVNTLHTPSK